MKEEMKRFSLLLACNDSEYVKKAYGGYFEVFVRAFGDGDGDGDGGGGEGETWDLFRVVQGEFPSMEDLDKYDGFVVSGSPHDAYGDDDWILDLCFLLQTLYAMQKRILGLCFGHQILCRALGGHVGKACTGWELGIRKMIIVEGLQHCRFLQGFGDVPPSASIIECHQDEVWQLPIGAEVLAFSDKTAVEAFFMGEHILGIQGHPEYTKDILLDIIDRLSRSNSINCKFADDAKANVEGGEPDRIFWEKLCKRFLKGC